MRLTPAETPPAVSVLIVASETASAPLSDRGAEVSRLVAAAGLTGVRVTARQAAANWRTAAAVVLDAAAVAEVGACLAPGHATGGGPVVTVVMAAGERSPALRELVALGVGEVVELPGDERRLVDRLVAVQDAQRSRAHLLVVTGGHGGAGASVLAAALAVTSAQRGRRTLLVDADPLGGGIDILFGAEHAPGLRWSELAAVRGRVAPDSLPASLPRLGDLWLLSAGRPVSGAVAELPVPAAATLLAAALRAFDEVIVDLPRGVVPSPLGPTVAVSDLVLLVVTTELRATAAAAWAAARLRPLAPHVELVARTPGRTPGRGRGGGLRTADVAAAVGLPLAGELRPEPGLAAALVRGDAPARSGSGPLATICGQLLERNPSPPGASSSVRPRCARGAPAVSPR